MEQEKEHRPPLNLLKEQMLHTARIAIQQHSQVSDDRENLWSNNGGLATYLGGLSPRHSACLATMRDITSAIQQESFHGRDMCLSKSSLEGPLAEVNHQLIFLDVETKSRVLIERLTYEEACVSHVGELVERMDAIATLSSRSIVNSIFPVLEYSGYYHDTSKFEVGFVYDIPALRGIPTQ